MEAIQLIDSIQQIKLSEKSLEDALQFESISLDLLEKGYSIKPNALPLCLSTVLKEHLEKMSEEKFISAGVGREHNHILNNFVRSDQICWITGESDAGKQWLTWTNELKNYLNRRLFLGLFSFESHFSHYAVGDFYKRHLDAFKGEANRIVSVVAYLNENWSIEDGGELVLYKNEGSDESLKVTPSLGTVVIFLSEDFPHEVLPSKRDRYGIAGWYRVNSSVTGKVDPPI